MVSWPMLADNFTLDWYPIALFYRLYPHSLTVLVLQGVGLGASRFWLPSSGAGSIQD